LTPPELLDDLVSEEFSDVSLVWLLTEGFLEQIGYDLDLVSHIGLYSNLIQALCVMDEQKEHVL
jgi:hypothetical protein